METRHVKDIDERFKEIINDSETEAEKLIKEARSKGDIKPK